jgi:hypothetical protein
MSEFTGVTILPGTAYKFKVRVKMFDTWGNFGSTCTITTSGIASSGSIPTTQLVASRCNTTLPGINVTLRGAWVSDQVTSHTFAIVDSNNTVLSEVESTTNGITLSQFTGVSITEGTTYNIRVKVKVNNTWGNYGNVCTVTTPGQTQNFSDEEIPSIFVQSEKFVAYPNPFNNDFTIRLIDTSEANILVFDINGRLVENKHVNDVLDVNLGNNLSIGIYVVKVEQNGKNESFKMIKK